MEAPTNVLIFILSNFTRLSLFLINRHIFPTSNFVQLNCDIPNVSVVTNFLLMPMQITLENI